MEEKLSPQDRESLIYQFRQYSQSGPLRGQVYRHYRGGLYVVTGRAMDEATLTDTVVYRSLETGDQFTRPYTEWIGRVPRWDPETGQDEPGPVGVTGGVPRFTSTQCVLDLGGQ